ncbi:MAG: tol-pal system protein YbgF [Deltaproteobacteria bacterium]|jgi:tol-pal system protein YbgF|nr:tol-pal system protein YbgF [Deltaproteobacteria bacterium]MBW2542299.1 tol-pal system protein YbgF [Deltaproteobacteria bacterium]
MNRGYAALVLALPLLTGCVTVAEFRKVQRDVIDLKRNAAKGGEGAPRERVADLAVRLDALEQENELLNGRLEVAEHRAEEALREARAARQESALGAVDSEAAAPGEGAELGSDGDGNTMLSEELAAYKAARSLWSSSDWEACVDRLGEFLQTYPSSVYADDAAYWRADCYFQQGNYKKAILRFDDVVARYPNGNKAADALYREGEALLRLGPAYNTAARKAFERVLNEYPDSDRAVEAKQQIDLL